ncbi:MAG: hypothetical protein BBJ57_03355 [Desulfobacterales bacterium PC51MH44]|nr:MAG: hypothetical protein BBJ57_03355 [Desulfobacterales bacterium PC51MH44]
MRQGASFRDINQDKIRITVGFKSQVYFKFYPGLIFFPKTFTVNCQVAGCDIYKRLAIFIGFELKFPAGIQVGPVYSCIRIKRASRSAANPCP